MSYKPKDTKERILHRLKIAQGHLRKVTEMVENDEYCMSVITQSTAVQQALKEVDAILLENHLKGCVVDAIKDGRTVEAVSEIMTVFKKS